MASHAQIEANRRNAQLSTGPRTEAGRMASCKNALKHGLRSADALLVEESKHEFEQFATALTAELRPVGMLEEMAVERLVHLHWKLKRVPKLEAVSVQDMMLNPGRHVLALTAMAEDLRTFRHRKPVSTMILLQTYEQRLHRMIDAEMRELRLLRKEREQALATTKPAAHYRWSDPARGSASLRSDGESDKRTQFAPNSQDNPQLPQQSTAQDSAWLRQVCEPPNGARGYRRSRGIHG